MKLADWHEQALDELADLWVRITPAERNLVEAAVDRVNRLLRDDPWPQGESRAGDERVLVVDPLTVWFDIPAGAAYGRVLHVRMRRPRS